MKDLQSLINYINGGIKSRAWDTGYDGDGSACAEQILHQVYILFFGSKEELNGFKKASSDMPGSLTEGEAHWAAAEKAVKKALEDTYGGRIELGAIYWESTDLPELRDGEKAWVVQVTDGFFPLCNVFLVQKRKDGLTTWEVKELT